MVGQSVSQRMREFSDQLKLQCGSDIQTNHKESIYKRTDGAINLSRSLRIFTFSTTRGGGGVIRSDILGKWEKMFRELPRFELLTV